MASLKSIAGALAIMAASGMISDFDLIEKGREIHVKVWAAGPEAGAEVHQDVSTLLSRYSGGRTIVIIGAT